MVVSTIDKARLQGISLLVTFSSRTPTEQYDLFKIGRTFDGSGNVTAEDLGKIVTRCDGFKRLSWHNVSRAVDLAVVIGKDIYYDKAHLSPVAAIARTIGLRWGGDWSGSFQDYPHFENVVCQAHKSIEAPDHFDMFGACKTA